MFTGGLFTAVSLHTPAGPTSSHSTLNIERKQIPSWFGSLYHFYVYGLWILLINYWSCVIKAYTNTIESGEKNTLYNKNVSELPWVYRAKQSVLCRVGIGRKLVCIHHHDPANQGRERKCESVNKTKQGDEGLFLYCTIRSPLIQEREYFRFLIVKQSKFPH